MSGQIGAATAIGATAVLVAAVGRGGSAAASPRDLQALDGMLDTIGVWPGRL